MLEQGTTVVDSRHERGICHQTPSAATRHWCTSVGAVGEVCPAGVLRHARQRPSTMLRAGCIVANILNRVVERAMQVHGALGLHYM